MKNMDPLNDNVTTLLNQSTDKFVSELWRDGEFRRMITMLQQGRFWHLLFVVLTLLYCLPCGPLCFPFQPPHPLVGRPFLSFVWPRFCLSFSSVGPQRYSIVRELIFISVSLFCTLIQVKLFLSFFSPPVCSVSQWLLSSKTLPAIVFIPDWKRWAVWLLKSNSVCNNLQVILVFVAPSLDSPFLPLCDSVVWGPLVLVLGTASLQQWVYTAWVWFCHLTHTHWKQPLHIVFTPKNNNLSLFTVDGSR